MSEVINDHKARRSRGAGCIFKFKGSKYYWIAYTSGGKRRNESTKSTRKTDAQNLLTQRLGDIARGVVVTPKLGRITLEAGLKGVVADLKMNKRKSVDHTERRIRLRILKYFRADQQMNALTVADFEKYKVTRIEQGAANASVNRELAILRRAYRLAKDGGELLQVPAIRMLRENNRRMGFFERDQFDAVLQQLPEEVRAPVQFAYITGWRFSSEVLPLKTSQVDMSLGIVRLEVGTTKSGDGRTFVMTHELRAVLQRQMHSLEQLKKRGIICPFLFHRNGREIRNCRKAWTLACEAAGCPGKIFHDLRRTAVRNIDRAGVPRTTAMGMVGHKTESIYRRYKIDDEATYREAAAKLDAWTNAQVDLQVGQPQVKRFSKSGVRG